MTQTFDLESTRQDQDSWHLAKIQKEKTDAMQKYPKEIFNKLKTVSETFGLHYTVNIHIDSWKGLHMVEMIPERILYVS